MLRSPADAEVTVRGDARTRRGGRSNTARLGVSALVASCSFGCRDGAEPAPRSEPAPFEGILAPPSTPEARATWTDALAGPEPGLRGPLAALRFSMPQAAACERLASLCRGPGAVVSSLPAVEFLATWAPCRGDPRLADLRIDVPEAGAMDRLREAWGPPFVEDDDGTCWLGTSTGVRACTGGYTVPFGRPDHLTIELAPFVHASDLVAGEGRAFSFERGTLIGRTRAEIEAAFADACIGWLWRDDPRYLSIGLPAVDLASRTDLVLELKDDRVARWILAVQSYGPERGRVIDVLVARFGEGEPGQITEGGSELETLRWPGDPEIRVVRHAAAARLLVGPWGDRWAADGPPDRSDP